MTETFPNPRKRPRQARSVITFDIILEAAARILESDGFSGFNTNIVADTAGVSIGSLYQYFPSKNALIVELIRRERDQLYNSVLKIIEQNERLDLKTLLKMIIERAVFHQLSRPNLALILESASIFIGKDYEEESFQYKLEEILSNLLSKFQITDVLKIARDIIAISKGMINTAGMTGEFDVEDLQRRVERAIYGYLALI